MLFNIEYDKGSELGGYCAPDGYSEVAVCRVLGNGEVLFEQPCNLIQESMLQARRHETGMVCFRFDEEMIPGLRDISDLEIREAKTNVLIYRREKPEEHIPKRLFRLETHLAPKVYLDKSLVPFFQYDAISIHHYGHETVNQFFHLKNYSSCYLSGRVLIKNYEQFLTPDLISVVAIQEPHYELALRILLFSHFGKLNKSFLSERDQLNFRPAIEYFADLDIRDEKRVRQLLKTAPKKIAGLLSSPMVKQLVAKNNDEQVSYRSVSQAIEILSRFDFVALDGGPVTLTAGIADLIGISSKALFDSPKSDAFNNFAEIIADIPSTDIMLESDLVLFHYLKEAVSEIDHNL